MASPAPTFLFYLNNWSSSPDLVTVKLMMVTLMHTWKRSTGQPAYNSECFLYENTICCYPDRSISSPTVRTPTLPHPDTVSTVWLHNMIFPAKMSGSLAPQPLQLQKSFRCFKERWPRKGFETILESTAWAFRVCLTFDKPVSVLRFSSWYLNTGIIIVTIQKIIMKTNWDNKKLLKVIKS